MIKYRAISLWADVRAHVWRNPLLIQCRLAFWKCFWHGSRIGCQQPVGTFCSIDSTSIWRPSEVKFAHFDEHRCFVLLASENKRLRSEELPSALLSVGWGRRISFFFFSTSPHSLSFLSFWSHCQIFLVFYEWRLPESSLGNGCLKKTFEKMCQSKPSPLIKPLFQWERKKKAKE